MLYMKINMEITLKIVFPSPTNIPKYTKLISGLILISDLSINGEKKKSTTLNPSLRNWITCDVSARSEDLSLVKYTWTRGDNSLSHKTRTIFINGTEGQMETFTCTASLAKYGTQLLAMHVIEYNAMGCFIRLMLLVYQPSHSGPDQLAKVYYMVNILGKVIIVAVCSMHQWSAFPACIPSRIKDDYTHNRSVPASVLIFMQSVFHFTYLGLFANITWTVRWDITATAIITTVPSTGCPATGRPNLYTTILTPMALASVFNFRVNLFQSKCY